MRNRTRNIAPQMHWLTFSAALLLSAGLAACTLGEPPPTLYVLGVPTAPITRTVSEMGLPVVQVLPVEVPDYLDTTDLLTRNGSELISSTTGRWGERLSVGVTRDLIAMLAVRLPDLAVTTTAPIDRPARQVLVDIDTYEARADHEVVLVAHWTITDGKRETALDVQQVSVAVLVQSNDDASIVAAMSSALGDIAGQIAARIERDPPLTAANQNIRGQTADFSHELDIGSTLSTSPDQSP